MVKVIATFIYQWTLCRDYKHCIGICNKKFSKEEIERFVEESWGNKEQVWCDECGGYEGA